MKEGSEILPDSDLDKEEKEEDSQIKNSKFRNISQLGIAQKETETIVLNPETLDLDSYYLLLKRNLRYLPTDKETGENIKQNCSNDYLFVMNIKIHRFICMPHQKHYRQTLTCYWTVS